MFFEVGTCQCDISLTNFNFHKNSFWRMGPSKAYMKTWFKALSLLKRAPTKNGNYGSYRVPLKNLRDPRIPSKNILKNLQKAYLEIHVYNK